MLAVGACLASLSLAADDATRRVQFREPHGRAYLLQASSQAGVSSNALRIARTAMPHWTEARIEGSTNPVWLGDRLVLKVEAGLDPEKLLAGRNLIVARVVGPGLMVLQAADSAAAIDAAEEFARQTGVIASYPVMRRAWRRHNAYAQAPNDPLFGRQWHLENRATSGNLAGLDLNVRAAWPVTRGEGVLVAVADDGVQMDHPELQQPTAAGPHYNFFEDAAGGEPASSDANHGTAVAGLIAAAANNDEATNASRGVDCPGHSYHRHRP